MTRTQGGSMKRYQPDVIYTRVGGSPKHELHEHVSGDYVLHSDHEAALAAAVHAAEVATWAKAGAEHNAALAEAVKKEREACAQLVHAHSGALYDACHQAALAIRARSDKP
jgi:hypothetical protein